MANEQKENATQGKDAPNVDKQQKNERIEEGRSQDTDEQKGNAATAGGLEGTYSFEDERETEPVDIEWSPGSEPAKS